MVFEWSVIYIGFLEDFGYVVVEVIIILFVGIILFSKKGKVFLEDFGFFCFFVVWLDGILFFCNEVVELFIDRLLVVVIFKIGLKIFSNIFCGVFLGFFGCIFW